MCGILKTYMKNRFKKLQAAVLAFVLLLSVITLSGCTGWLNVGVENISFVSGGTSLSRLELALGERVELNRYISITPASAVNKAFTVVSDNESVVKIETVSQGSVVSRVYAVAEGTGSATLTATAADNGKTAKLKVAVSYAEPNGISISAQGDFEVFSDTIVISGDSLSEVKFKAELGDNVSPECSVTWSAGEERVVLLQSEQFGFTPLSVGRTAVTASVKDSAGKLYSDVLYVNVADKLENTLVGYDAQKLVQQAGEYQTVYFNLSYDAPAEGNPEPVVVWYVNGEINGFGEEFGFLPKSPGIYEISVKANGRIVAFGGESSVSVLARGTVVPANVWLDYDNCYPQVWVRWDSIPAAAGYEVSLVNLNTGRVVSSDISTENLSLRDKFTDSGVDVSDYVKDANSIFNARLAVKVKTLGDENGVLGESAWSNEYTSKVVPVAARAYLQKKFYDGVRNYYVKSYEEFYEWFEYAMLWRPSTLTDGESLYLDYSYVSASDEIDKAMNSMHFTGSYDYSGADETKNVGKFRIRFFTDGEPTRKTSAHTGQAWNAMRPHVNYDDSKVRNSRYVFPIDYKTPVTVRNSEQLYYLAQLGYRPMPESGSAAERLYNYARRTLRHIISDDMTDVQKLHAIYDWIMWRVIYDNEVLQYSALSNAVKYESYYLESVFTDSDYYGVCDAMSKAFVLMCSIEGFECVRVTGYAGSVGNRGGHAWNKVKLNGRWYIVDCTWGDASVQLIAGGAARESANHAYFLVTDADVASTHEEDAGSSFPRTAPTRYAWYDEEFEYNGGSLDFYLDGRLVSESAMRNELSLLVDYMAYETRNSSREYSVGADPAANTVSSQYRCYEFVSDTRWGDPKSSGWANSALMRNLNAAMREKGYTSGYDYYVVTEMMSGDVHVMLFIKIEA